MNSKKTVLVVDDTVENIQVIDAVLPPEYNLLAALDGEKALRIARSDSRPDVILLDVMMPGMDGYEVCRRLKADPVTSGIPVIFITALSDASDEAHGLESGAVDYITKPISAPILTARLRTHLALHALNQGLERQVQARTLELQAAKERAEDASRAKTRFLSNVSHELRTPLNAILGFGQLLEASGAIDDGDRESVEEILNNGHRLLKLVDDILQFARLDEKCPAAGHSQFNIYECIEGLVSEIAPKAEKQGIALDVEVSAEVPDVLLGNPRDARQILGYLGDNAVKFNVAGGQVSLRVDVEDGDEDEATVLVHFSLEDTGIGLTTDQQKRLFQPFTQLDDSISRQHGGTGVGLALAKKMTDELGGLIWAESEPNVGSTFHLVLPFKKP